MDRPPPNHGTGGDRFPTGPGRPEPTEPTPREPYTHHEHDDPDPGSRRPDLYRPQHTDAAGAEAATADAMPTEPIAMPTEPLPILPNPEQTGAIPRYEGNWADWMTPADSADRPTEPAAEPSNATPPEPPAAPTASPAPDTTPASAGTTAQQRLRDRLAPPEVPAPVTDRPAEATRSPRTRLLPAALGVAGVAALTAAAYVQFAVIGGDDPATPAAAPTAPPDTTAPPAADPNCPAERSGHTVQGNGPGGTDSGTAAIFGFQHAYYVERSGDSARELVTPDSAVPSAVDIQRGIDSIPAGTTHCIQISPGAFVGQYQVVITEHRPEAAPLAYNPQFVTTRPIGDRTLIHSIGPMP